MSFYHIILDKLIKDYTTEGNCEDLKLQYDVFTNARKRFRDAKHFSINMIKEQAEVNNYVDTLKSVGKDVYLELLPYKPITRLSISFIIHHLCLLESFQSGFQSPTHASRS